MAEWLGYRLQSGNMRVRISFWLLWVVRTMVVYWTVTPRMEVRLLHNPHVHYLDLFTLTEHL